MASLKERIRARFGAPPDPWEVPRARRRDIGDPPGAWQPPCILWSVDGFGLNAVQRRAMWHATRVHGLLGAIGVGHGKTLLAWILAHVWSAQLGHPAVVLAPGGLRDHVLAEWKRYRAHWEPQGSSSVFLKSYAWLSTNPDGLWDLKPGAIVADECHKLRNPTAARTRRVGRYLEEHPGVRFAGLSGSVMASSIGDFAHLCRWCLGDQSPFPADSTAVAAVALVTDVDAHKRGGVPSWARAKCGPMDTREAVRRELEDTAGFIVTEDASASCSLEVGWVDVPMTESLSDAVERLDTLWELPNGDPICEPTQLADAQRQLSQGFFYRWAWGPEGPDWPWLEASRAWAAAQRDWLTRKSVPLGLDTMALVRDACASGEAPTPELADAWALWEPVRERRPPPRVAVWLDPQRIDKLALAGAGLGCSALWLAHRAARERAGDQVRGLSVYSVRKDGTGRHLAQHSDALSVMVPSTADTMEQLLGRHHRQGQAADAVRWWWLDVPWNRAAMAACQQRARGVLETTGLRQKILYAANLNTNGEKNDD